MGRFFVSMIALLGIDLTYIYNVTPFLSLLKQISRNKKAKKVASFPKKS
jgi:hypothetical protein